MLLPRFTLRTGLLVLTAVALLAVAGRAAMAGEYWAIGLAVGVGSVFVMLLAHALVFGFAMLVSRDATVPQAAEPNQPHRVREDMEGVK